MITSFKDEGTKDVFDGVSSKKALRLPVTLWKIARRKLDMLDAAHELLDLQSPPGNRLEALQGDLKGRHSIRINDKYRIVFCWDAGHVADVEIVDYH